MVGAMAIITIELHRHILLGTFGKISMTALFGVQVYIDVTIS